MNKIEACAYVTEFCTNSKMFDFINFHYCTMNQSFVAIVLISVPINIDVLGGIYIFSFPLFGNKCHKLYSSCVGEIISDIEYDSATGCCHIGSLRKWFSWCNNSCDCWVKWWWSLGYYWVNFRSWNASHKCWSSHRCLNLRLSHSK